MIQRAASSLAVRRKTKAAPRELRLQPIEQSTFPSMLLSARRKQWPMENNKNLLR
jgi:hypothetical protein